MQKKELLNELGTNSTNTLTNKTFHKDIDLGYVTLGVSRTLTLFEDELDFTKVHEIKSNCTCISIDDWRIVKDRLNIKITIHSKSDLVVFQEKRLYLWQIKRLGDGEEKLLICQINLKYS